MGTCSIASVIAAWKTPNPVPAHLAQCFFKSWASRIKALHLHSLSYRSCSAQSRQGQTLIAFSILEGKNPEGARGQDGVIWKTPTVSIFLCWREKVFAIGAWPGSPFDTRAWRRTHRVGFQGGTQRSGMYWTRPLSSSRSCSCLGLVVLLGLEQRRESGSFFCSLQHRVGD